MTSLIPNLDARWQGVVSHTHRGHSTPEERTLNTGWRGRLVGPTAYLDAFEKRKPMNRTTIPQMTSPYLISLKITLSRLLYCWNKHCETKKNKKKDDICEHFFPYDLLECWQCLLKNQCYFFHANHIVYRRYVELNNSDSFPRLTTGCCLLTRVRRSNLGKWLWWLPSALHFMPFKGKVFNAISVTDILCPRTLTVTHSAIYHTSSLMDDM
jgi:hypothetical protein